MDSHVQEVQEKMEHTSISARLEALKQPVLSAEALNQGAKQWKYCFLSKLYSEKEYSVGDMDKELKKLWNKSKDMISSLTKKKMKAASWLSFTPRKSMI